MADLCKKKGGECILRTYSLDLRQRVSNYAQEGHRRRYAIYLKQDIII
ncbi:hypothetical protein AGMMS50222_09710 [Endomicrobiia bacterium]|nr:hypothetical protein AGMMS50222_09710 [Endomicrobiia bacterium]